MSDSIESNGSESLEGAPVEEVMNEEAVEEVVPEVKKIKKLKLKFNGREIEEDLPFEVDETHADWLVKQRQKAMLADHKANEYSQLEKEIGQFIKELRQNPKKALSNPMVGIDVKQLAAQILQEEIEQAQKSPEQIERERLEEELRAIKEEREAEKQRLKEQELKILEEREIERFDTLISEAISASDLPKSPYVVKKMTDLLILGIENGLNVKPADIVPLIREELHNDIREMMDVMPAEMIEQLVGKGNVDKLRKKRVSAAAKAPVPVKKQVVDVGTQPKKEEKKQEPKTFKDFFGV